MSKLKTQPERNAHLVREAINRAQERYGKHWHLLSEDMRNALIRSEGFNVILLQNDESNPMVRFALDLVHELNAREET